MKHLTLSLDPDSTSGLAEARNQGPALTELSDADLQKVAGGSNCWIYVPGAGIVESDHSGYPETY